MPSRSRSREYLTSGDFYEAVFENWESEFLQMGSYVVLTVFLFQKGSSESKPLNKRAPQDEDPRTARVRPPRAVARAQRRDRPCWSTRTPSSSCSRSCSSARSSRTQRAVPRPTARSSRSTDSPASRSAQYLGTVAVLVRVVPELAERVHGRGAAHWRLDLPAPARVARVKARACPLCGDRRLSPWARTLRARCGPSHNRWYRPRLTPSLWA